MAFKFFDSKKNFFLMIILIFFTKLKSYNFSKCSSNDDFNSKTCFNNIIKFDSKKYRAGQICTNKNNDLIIEYSDASPGNSRLFYSLKENGHGFFPNEETTKEINITGDKIYNRYESINAFVSIESDKKKEKQYLLSISCNKSLTELHDIEGGTYQQWLTTEFLNIEENRYIISLRFSLLEWKNTNIYFLVFIQKAGSDSDGNDFSNSYTIKKFSLKKENGKIKINHLLKIEDKCMYNVQVISATIVDIYDILIVAYVNENKKLAVKFYNSNLKENTSFYNYNIDPILNPGTGLFYKLITCKDDYISIIFFQNMYDGNSIKIKFIKIIKDSGNQFYLENLDAHYGFGIYLKQYISLNDYYKINDDTFIFVSTIDYTQLYIVIIKTKKNYTSHSIKEYQFNLASSTNNIKFTKELSLGMYKGFLLFTSTISTNIDYADDFSSYLIFIGYANGTDFTVDISPYFADIEGYDINNDIVKFLLEHASIDNNVFNYNLIRKIKLISIPKEIIIYNKNDLIQPIPNGTIIDEGNYLLYQNKKITKTNKLYELEYQYMVQDPFNNSQILFGRVNKFSMKLCHEFCDSCQQLGISNNVQNCLSCLESYTYDYFIYFNIFHSNCVPEGYYYDKELNQLIQCETVQYKYYYNLTDNNKRICFKYEYECPTSYNILDQNDNECFNYIDTLYEDLSEDYTNKVISNLSSLLNAYVFLDIAKNPKKFKTTHSTHEPTDLIDSLKKVKRDNRQYYEFYREIKEILGSVKDMHFNIYSIQSPTDRLLSAISVCIPFSFYVEKDNNDNKIKVYIKYFEECAKYYSDDIKNYVWTKSETKVALKLINGKDPFEYIQNFGWNYFGTKSPHGYFSYVKTIIHSVYLYLYPFTPDELNVKYEFESNDDKDDFIILDYYLVYPTIITLTNQYKSNNNLLNNYDDNKFLEFFKEEMKKYETNINIPNIFEMFDKYSEKNGIFKESLKIKKVIRWNYETDYNSDDKDGIKCRVDDINQVNVFLQQKFMLDFFNAADVIIKCIQLFYSNNYPIIGIENHNGGGVILLAQIFHQLLQVKIQDNMFFAGRSTNYFKKAIEPFFSNIIDVETCQPFKDIDEFMNGIIDDYSNNVKNIIHKRTKIFDFGTKDLKELIHYHRKSLYENGKLKRPTDIIIFTDGFSFSATSLFIKGFQKTGGAITVGFNGNPTLSKDLFDASQSPTNVQKFNDSVEVSNLKQVGFVVDGISASESFSYDYKNKNAMPLEYDFDPVDERVDIYNDYSDEIYQNFIDKGKEIFKKYNIDKKCNYKNKRLLFDPNDGKTCYNYLDDPHVHGGYECGYNGYWDNSCKKFYCDLGYYYDLYENKCKQYSCLTVDNTTNITQIEEINLEGEYNNRIILNNSNHKEYIFHLNNSKYIYFFKVEGNEGYIHYDLDKPCPNLCVIQKPNIINYTTIYLNLYQNVTNQTIIVYISSFIIDTNITSSISLKYYNETINTIKPLTFKNSFYIIEGNINYISYFEIYAKNTKIKYTIYEPKITETDILTINEKYFSDCNSELIHLEKGKIYIISISGSPIDLNKPIKILLQPYNISNNIYIQKDKPNLLFLSKNEKEYILDFYNNNQNKIIQLSRALKNAEIEIKEENKQNIIILNSSNIYYIFSEENKVYKNKLSVKVKEDTLIEFLLHFPDNIEILKNKEYKHYKIKGNTVISFENNAFEESINITLYTKENKLFKYSIISGNTIDKYYHYSSEYNIELIKSIQPFETIEVKLKKNNFIKDEYFYMMFIFDENNIEQIYLNKTEQFNIDIFNVEINNDKSEIIMNNIIKLIEEGYIYNDIIKNPPNIENYGKVDLISELKKVETNNRKYLDFYRDIRKIMSKVKDVHFNILPKKSPNNYELDNLELCLPFSFYINGDSKEFTKLYIEINEDCYHYFSTKQQNFISSHLNKSLLYINKTDPFEFIQNLQSEFNQIHNKQAQFSITLETAHKLSFIHNPFTKEQISNIEFIFEGNDIINLNYYLKYKGKNDVKENKDSKEWKYSSNINNGFKCLVDKEKKVNVFILGSLKINNDEDYLNTLEIILNCTKEFYNNSFPIIGIDNDNNEGDIKIGLYLAQLLQVKLSQRTYFALKNTNLIENIVNKNINNNLDIINIETCENINNFEELKEVIDDYGKDIKLNRTKVFQIFNKTKIEQINNLRIELYKLNNLKRPTDIIIFTDGYSLGSSSFFIRNLQERGGAIIVGYKGNPKKDEVFDSTQSLSYPYSFKETDIYNNLLECGLSINDISFYLSYNDSYQKNNSIPREFNIFPVDERVNIYHKYNDSYYDEFINKGLEIFDKYNKQKKCNKNNLLLTLDPNDDESCYIFDNDKHAHGGYQCNNDGTWSDICIPYYCELGYLFDTYSKKCIKDICINNTDDYNNDSDSETSSQDSKTEPEKKEEMKNFPVYAIVLLSIGSVLIILVIIFIIIKCCGKKNINSDIIESMNINE